jgi:integral membrane protein (TIGR01906 family)
MALPADVFWRKKMKEKASKLLWYGLSSIAGLLLALAFALTGIEAVAFNRDRYENAYARLHTAADIGVSQDELIGITDQVILYLRGEYPDLFRISEINGVPQSTFREREILHMMDVKALFQRGYLLRGIAFGASATIICFSVFFLKQKSLSFILIGYEIGVGILLSLCILVGVYFSLDFSKAFIQFHHVFFTNDMWLLSHNDMLIQMFPEQFFSEMTFAILVHMILWVIVPLLLVIVAQIILKYRKNK